MAFSASARTAAALVMLAACTPHGGSSAPSPAADRRSADAFLAAWRRSLTTTWAIDAVFERRVGSKHVSYDIREARRPPDHLRDAGGSVEGQVNGRVVGCTPLSTGGVTCRDGGPAPAYDDEVRSELDTLAGYFSGTNPLYRAASLGGGCFGLTLRRTILAPPYGQTARFCFDRATGAPSSSEVHKRGSVDVTRATAIRAKPTPADLTPPSSSAPPGSTTTTLTPPPTQPGAPSTTGSPAT
ncbi:MAG: hypothetical protein JOZ37_17345 [Actinobacteria bacterium]|nr:hypothetical protein [Actinomycetota bacterium]